MFNEIDVFDPKAAKEYMARYNYTEGRSVADSIGRSSAACLMIAEELAIRHPGAIIVTLNYDRGDRYDISVKPFTPSLSINDSLAYSRYEPSKNKPLGYRQQRPETPRDIPRTLQEAYLK